MTNTQLKKWIQKLGQAWEERDPEAIPQLFAENFKYYETPFEKPYTKKTDLIRLWQDVPKSQKDIKFEFEIISINKNMGIAHWKASFIRIKNHTKACLDGIFLIKLDNQGLCTEFRQWWVTKE
jgi:hypothetical protein